MTEQAAINYSVKELLAKLEGKIDALMIAVADKVSRGEFNALVLDVAALKQSKSSANTVLSVGKYLLGLAAVLGAAAIGHFLP